MHGRGQPHHCLHSLLCSHTFLQPQLGGWTRAIQERWGNNTPRRGPSGDSLTRDGRSLGACSASPEVSNRWSQGHALADGAAKVLVHPFPPGAPPDPSHGLQALHTHRAWGRPCSSSPPPRPRTNFHGLSQCEGCTSSPSPMKSAPGRMGGSNKAGMGALQQGLGGG